MIIETGVTSDPEPAVVGIRTNGSLELYMLSTPQILSSEVSYFNRTEATFATSRDDPPPIPITPSTSLLIPYSTQSNTF